MCPFRFHCVSAAILAAHCSGGALAQSRPNIVIEAPEGSIEFGRSLASGGDANNDGFDDVFAGAHIIIEVPRNAASGSAWLQALDVYDPTRGPITSNVLEVRVLE